MNDAELLKEMRRVFSASRWRQYGALLDKSARKVLLFWNKTDLTLCGVKPTYSPSAKGMRPSCSKDVAIVYLHWRTCNKKRDAPALSGWKPAGIRPNKYDKVANRPVRQASGLRYLLISGRHELVGVGGRQIFQGSVQEAHAQQHFLGILPGGRIGCPQRVRLPES